ncbi:hypothetical protein KUV57_13800 [Epibacterium sp. DP7N7-1]|nr:hypothetical protein [Epibacterium sp. DP7N7-1]
MPQLLPDPDLVEQYTQGECHIFAAASVIRHGGSFLVAYDSGKIHWETDDDIIHEVLHVFAVHEGPDGEVIRDIRGDRLAPSRKQIEEELAEAFQVPARDIYMTYEAAEELLTLVGDPAGRLAGALSVEPGFAVMDDDDRPLTEATGRDLSDALDLDEARAFPGSRPAPVLEEDLTPEI